MVFVLGNRVAAPTEYSPDILERIEREDSARSLSPQLDVIYGYDCWHLYELSWLTGDGVPEHFVGVLFVDVNSAATIESKSLKLYLNSLNFHRFDNSEAAKSVICSDIQNLTESAVTLELFSPTEISTITREPDGILLDEPSADVSSASTTWFSTTTRSVTETLVSHRLRSLCPVTGQPDWGSLVVNYTGHQINRARIQDMVASFREHQDFHERCVEQCFSSIFSNANPKSLSVTAYYQRRGGIDITPVRSSEPVTRQLWRMGRQ